MTKAMWRKVAIGLVCIALICPLFAGLVHAENVEPEPLHITPQGIWLDAGQTHQFAVAELPETEAVTWSSSDPGLLAVDENGLATAGVGDGQVTVTAQTEDGRIGTAEVTVFSQPNLLTNGDFEQDASVGWSPIAACIKDGVGEYGSRGVEFGRPSGYYKLPIPLKPATTYILSYRYKAERGANFRVYAVDLGAGQLRPSVFVPTGESIEDAPWQTASMVFTTTDYYDPELYWCLSVSGGSRTKKAYMDNLTIREYVTKEAVETLTLDVHEATVEAGRSVTLSPVTVPEDADLNALEWTSSDEDVAYVVSGHVLGVSAGTATITATAKSGAFATCEVTVVGNGVLVKNGTFETDVGWELAGNAVYAPGEGLHGTNGLTLYAEADNNGTVSQTVENLEPSKPYQVQFRFRRRTPTTFATVTVTHGETVLGQLTFGGTSGSVSYQAGVTKLDFRTPKQLTDEVKLTVTCTEGEYVTLDQMVITQAASDLDLLIPELTWSPNDADQVTPGEEVSFMIPIVNFGTENYNQDVPISVEVFVDAQVVHTFTYTDPLPVGETAVLTTPSWTATAGDHTVTARINGTWDIIECDETNNVISRNLLVTDTLLQPPAAALDKGFNRLVFSDHFDGYHTFDTTASGEHGYKWYVTRPWGEANLTAEDYRVENGVLYLTTDDTRWNYSICTIDAKNEGVGFAFNKGYMEIRVRMKKTATDGTVENIRVPAVWSFSTDTIWETWRNDEMPTHQGVELDWFEYWGTKYGAPYFETTLHDTVTDEESGKQLSHVTVAQAFDEPIGDGRWHTYGMSWSDGLLKIYFDNEYKCKILYGADNQPIPMATETVKGGLGLRDGLFTTLDSQMMAVILGGASDFPLEVDWIRVWQADGTVEPAREPDVEVDWFIEDYLYDENGKRYTALTADTYLDILAARTAYEELTPLQRYDVDARLGISFGSWLTQAHEAAMVVDNFIFYYACAEDGTPYTVVDETNYEWIASAATEWGTLSPLAKAIIEQTVEDQIGMSFSALLEQALAFVPPVEEVVQPTPVQTAPKTAKRVRVDLTPLWIALGAVGAVVVVGGTVIALRLFKRKHSK